VRKRKYVTIALSSLILVGTSLGVAGASTMTTPNHNSQQVNIAKLDEASRLINEVRASLTPTTPPPTPPPTPPTPPPPTATGTTAAERFAWGTPLSQWSDEFTTDGVPNQSKWSLAGGGINKSWPGHAGNGRRAEINTRIVNNILTQIGSVNGDSGWIASKWETKYGRWEARVRSSATSTNNGRQYHPLLIIWPTSNRWPEDGEYDFLENGAPGEQAAESFIHYPHPASSSVQQEFKRSSPLEGGGLSQWHNIAFEWTPNHVKGFIDGQEWFSYSGGEGTGGRKAIQSMPSGHLTIQLDNFFGSGMQSAKYEIDWVRMYSV
jgi:hypothetical protein